MNTLNETQESFYKMLKKKQNQDEMMIVTGTTRPYVLQSLNALVKLGMATLKKDKRNNIYTAIVQPYTIVNRKRKMTRMRALRRLVKKYGSDNIRFIAYQKESPPEYVAKKTGVSENQLELIISALAV